MPVPKRATVWTALVLTGTLAVAGCSDDSGSDDAAPAPTAAVTAPASDSGRHAFGQPDGSCPTDKPVKGVDTLRGKYALKPSDAGYPTARAAFCFADVPAARRAGFKKRP